MTITIRQATITDALAIERVRKSVWPDENVKYAHISSIIADITHATLVAVVDHYVVGFVDGFMTRCIDNHKRWEVDLLAVHPDFQRQGIAKQLITASTTTGVERGAELARALIHSENTSSEKAFAGCGYAAENDQCGLYVLSTNPVVLNEPPSPNGANIIRVNTITYSGVWVENEWSADSFMVADAERARQKVNVAGAVIPLKKTEAIQAAEAAGYAHIGTYRWWLKA